MATLLPMPEVVAGATEAVLSSWLVAEDAPFGVGDAIAVIETEKAAVDIEADTDAKLVRSLVADGATVTVGMPIAVLAAPDEQIDDVDAVLASLGVSGAPPEAAPAVDEVEDAPAQAAHPAVSAPAGTGGANGERIFASPLVRRLASEHGLELGTITGSGPNGRIVRRDIDRILVASVGTTNGSHPTPDPTPAAVVPAAPAAVEPARPAAVIPSGVEEIPHTRLRRAVARRLTESKQLSPHFYLRGSARIDGLLRLRAQVNEASPVRVSVNDLLLKAAAAALVRVPEMNVVWSDDAMLRYPTADISVAIASARGLVTPVLRGVESASLSSIATQVREFVTRADEGRLAQSDLEGGTLTISNLGMYGVEEFAAIINPPQAAILAVGAGRREPVVEQDGTLGVATLMRATLSVDHRAVDGALAARWMSEFVGAVENPLSVLV